MLRRTIDLPYEKLGMSTMMRFSRHRCGVVHMGLDLQDDPKNYRWDNRRRGREALFQYTISGEGRFRDGTTDNVSVMRAGQAFLVTYPSDTQYWLPKGKTWEFIWITLLGDMAIDHAEELIRRHGHILELPLNSRPVVILFNIYRLMLHESTRDDITISVAACHFLLELARECSRGNSNMPERIANACAFLEEKFSDPRISIDAVAEVARYSKYHFSRLFKLYTGISPHQYLLRRRLQRAAELIGSTNFSVKEIAHLVGFINPLYFSSVFLKHMGITPANLRRYRRPY